MDDVQNYETAIRMAATKMLDVVAPGWRVIDVTFGDDKVEFTAMNDAGVTVQSRDEVQEHD